MVAFLIGLALKSALIAAFALGLAELFAKRPPGERATVLRVAVCLLLALPVIALASPDIPLRLLPASAVSEPGPVVWSGQIGPVRGASIEGEVASPPVSSFLTPFYVLGVLLVFGRFLVGLWTLSSWTRSGHPVRSARWLTALDRLSPARRPRLICAEAVQSPLSWGLPPGAVLIGRADLARPQDAEAVLAHEIAHIRRADWVFLALSRLALALFWFNPLVWRLHGALAQSSEEAADALAVRSIDRQAYARVLVSLAAQPTPHAALGIAGPARSLSRRIKTLMKTPGTTRPRPLVIALSIGALVVVATPLAAIEIANRDQAPEASTTAQTPPRTVETYTFLESSQPAPLPPLPPVPPLPRSDITTPPVPAVPASPLAAPQAPPPPPAPPAPRRNGTRVVYRSEADLDPATRAAVVQARRAADQARVHADEARGVAERARATAQVQQERALHQAQAAREQAMHARVQADEARLQAAHALTEARLQMRAGADEMATGARQMREESARLRDPDYRAQQIAEARARGETVTDERLRALVPQLARQADELEAQAERLRRQGDLPPLA